MRTITLAALAVTAVAVAGCHGATANGSPNRSPSRVSIGQQIPTNTGLLTGKFRVVGGPALPSGRTRNRPLMGTIDVHRASKTGPIQTSVSVPKNGKFSTRLPPGTYYLVGRTPQITGPGGGCPALHPVTVTADHIVRENVLCEVP